MTTHAVFRFGTPVIRADKNVVLVRGDNCDKCVFIGVGATRAAVCNANELYPGCAGGHYIDEDEFLKRRLQGKV